MKLTIILIVVSVLSVFSSESYSQTKKLTLKFKDATVEDILDNIEKQSEFYFFIYSEKVIDVERKVSIDIENQTIETVLNKLFEGTEMAYAINDRLVILSTPEIIGSTPRAVWQQATVSGKVTDSSNQPLPGVSIVIKGTTQGTVTNADGNYALTNIPQNTVLVFSFVGMRTQEIAVGSQTMINVSMEEETISIEEVVAVGYGTQKKINLTGSVSNASSEVLKNRPITNIGQGLQGVVPGLNITQSTGDPGRGTSFNIRGFTSINGGSPLILVDGIPMDINSINPNDVESVSILKDAASAAIYGARAAYGVILVTTKSGKEVGKPIISLSMNTSINKPTVDFETMDSKQRMEYINIGCIRANTLPYFDEYSVEAILAHYNDPSKPEVFLHPNVSAPMWKYSANTNWAEVLERNYTPMNEYRASISGMMNNVKYYTSFSYLYQEGIPKHFDEKFNRYNSLAKLSYDIKKWITVGADFSMVKSDRIWPAMYPESYRPINTQSVPHWPVYHPDGNYATGEAVGSSIVNQVQLQEIGGNQTRKSENMWMKSYVKLTPIKHMTFNLDYSYNTTIGKYSNYENELPHYDAEGRIIGYNPNQYPSNVERSLTEVDYKVFNAFADYENNFFEKHYFKALIGFNQEYRITNYFSAKRQDLIDGRIPFMSLASGDQFASDNQTEYSLRGAFSRINYSYDNKYLLEVNGRYDGTSKFPQRDRFDFFPSVSFGWIISNEDFFSRLNNTINNFKLRASYGTLGNQNVAENYPYISTLSTKPIQSMIGGELPMTVNTPALVSSKLTWETVVQKNLGIDFSILNNKLIGSLDIYRRDTKNMLTRSQKLPAVLGATEPRTNAADLKTEGFDFSLAWKNNYKNVRYGLTFVLSDYTSEITRFSNPEQLISEYYVGHKLGEIWGFTTGGMFQTDEEAANYMDQSDITARARLAGDLYFLDLNDDGAINRGNLTLKNPGDMSIIGNNTPRYSFGITPSVEWKRFNLEIFLQGIAKREGMINNTFFLAQYWSHWNNPPKSAADYWTPENTDAYFPAPLTRVDAGDVQATQTHFLQNTAYIRLKQLTLSYQIPTNLLEKINMNRIEVYFSGHNLWEATEMIEICDPEAPGAQYYPLHRTLSLGVNIDF